MSEPYTSDFTDKMTILSKKTFKKAAFELHSPEEAVGFLKEGLITRNVRTNLEKFSAGQDMKLVQKKLVDGLMEHHPEMEKDSIERRVRGWMNPKSLHSLKKKDAIEITFILRMDLEKAGQFVAQIAEEQFHWRDVEEIVYIYGLKNGVSYNECRKLLAGEKLQEIMKLVTDFHTVEKIEEANAFTEFIKAEVETLDSEEKLMNYLQNNYSKLGHFHNTAYDMFMEMIKNLESPEHMEEEYNIYVNPHASEKNSKSDEKETPPKYTIRDILVDYLYKDIVLDARQRAVKEKKEAKKNGLSKENLYTLDLIQKSVADSWPDEVSLSKMKHRKLDVTRKALILLFVATDGNYDDDIDYDYDLSEEEVFEDTLERMNEMLFFSGFSELDPRNPFDCLIINCISVTDVFDIDPKMLSVLEELFRE